MTYKWVSIGQQDELINKVCMLGPYLLDLREDYWDEEELVIKFSVFKWNEETKKYTKIKTNLKQERYNRDTSHTVLEDWYACNVLLEEHFGSEDEVVQGKRLQRR